MQKEQYIAGLDIGTQTIRVVQAKLDPETRVLSVIGAAHGIAGGMRKGVVVDIDEAVSSISHVLERLERITGVPVTHVTVSACGGHITCMESKGVIAVSRADGEIMENDIIRVIDASQAISIPPNREVIHVIPKNFTLDGQTGIKDPLGMSGIRLEVETLIIHGGTPLLKNLTKAINQAGLEIDQLVMAPISASEAVLTKRQKELGVILVDMGAGTTSIAIYEENSLIHTAVIPLGGMHITNDIAIGLRCSVETAEKIKIHYGHASSRSINVNEEIDLSLLDSEEQDKISRIALVEIIEARLEELFDYVLKELKKIHRDGKLPAGVVLTGAGASIPGLVDFVKFHLHLPTQVGRPTEIQTVIDQVSDQSFATAVGLILWASKFAPHHTSSGVFGQISGLMQSPVMQKLKKIFKSFLP